MDAWITVTTTDHDGGSDVLSVDVIVYVPGAAHTLSATGLVDIDHTPDVSCPPNDTQVAERLTTPVANLDALAVSCSVGTTTGRTEVHAEVADAELLNGQARSPSHIQAGPVSMCVVRRQPPHRLSTRSRAPGGPRTMTVVAHRY